MLFITPTSSAQGAKDYFSRALAHGDYYLRDAAEAPGVWHGLGSELLGLEGEVQKRDFFALCDNRNPLTGEALTARTKAGRRVLYDFTFDAPKAVSLAYEVGGDERILSAFREAVAETMGEMEAELHARVRAAGADGDRRTSNMIWAEFVHRTTRPVDGVPDPQLHCHAVAFNATYDSVEERWKAAQFGNLVRDKLYYQAAFHARLAGHLSDLGYAIRREGTSFTLDGVARATVAKFSRRTAQVEEAAERLGVVDAKSKGELGRRTRESKAKGASMGELRQGWCQRLTDRERDTLSPSRPESVAPESRRKAAGDAVGYAVAHSFERASVVPEKQLVAEALMHGVGRVAVGDVWKRARGADVIRRDVGGQTLATTREVYREELAMLAFARGGRGQCRKLGGTGAQDLPEELSVEQREAALQLLGSRDLVAGLRGGAGTGKTRMMQATVEAIERTGVHVFAFAPSAKASRGVLRDEGFSSADTVERLLTDKDLQAQVRGQVLWIDEAGLFSTRDMKRLFDFAKDAGCRVVLSGDSAQHSAVGRGDALRLLEREAGIRFAQLQGIRRQRDLEYRAAVREISQGDARGRDGRTQLQVGLERLDRMGSIAEIYGEARHARLASDYAQATDNRAGRAKTALVVSPTHREGESVARRIREELRARGRLGEDERSFLSLRSLGLTEAQRGALDSYRGGEVVRFHQNVPGFRRGERVTVTQRGKDGISVLRSDGSLAALPLNSARHFEVYDASERRLAAGDRLRITQNGFTREVRRAGRMVKSRLNNGDVLDVAGFTRDGDILAGNGFVIPKDYGGLTQGYVVTSHASQGSTVDRVLIALGHESLAAANRQQFYVSVSRGREAVRLYSDDKAALMEAVQTDAARPSATELLQSKGPRPAPRSSTARAVSLLRAKRSHQNWRDRTNQAAQWARIHEQHEEVRHGRH